MTKLYDIEFDWFDEQAFDNGKDVLDSLKNGLKHEEFCGIPGPVDKINATIKRIYPNN